MSIFKSLFPSVISKSVSALLVSALCVTATLSPSVYAEIDAPQSAVIAQVSINSADAQTLAEMITGVGEKKAAAIVAWREANGNFTSIDQLTEVKGIGAATLEKNRAKLTL